MSDTEGDARAPAPAALPADVGYMDLYQALQEVLIHDGLSRGVKEATKALDKRQVHLCVFVNSVDESLCAKHGINLLKVNDAKKLVEWAGLCKPDKEDKARKVNACGILIVKDYGKATPALDVVRDYFKSK